MFKPGDLVKCIRQGVTGFELSLNDTFVVAHVTPSNNIKIHGSRLTYNGTRFILVHRDNLNSVCYKIKEMEARRKCPK